MAAGMAGSRYMMCDIVLQGQQHGPGLLIVEQVASVHKGNVEMGHSI